MTPTHTTPNTPDRVYLTDANISRVFNEGEPGDPADFACITWIWRIILGIGVGVFGLLCWGIYELFN